MDGVNAAGAWMANGFDSAQQALFEGAVQPLLFACGLAGFLEEGYGATGWLLVGVLQLAVIVLVLVHAPFGWFVVGAGRNGVEYSVLLLVLLCCVGYRDYVRAKDRHHEFN